MVFITIDDRQIRRLEAHLIKFALRALPFATKQALNKSAFTAQKFAKENIRNSMVNRNAWTARSVQVDRAFTLRISEQQSSVGSVAPYMLTQEEGGRKRSEGKEGIRIPTSYASGEGLRAQPRRRMARKPNRMRDVVLKGKRLTGSNRGQRNKVAVIMASKTQNKLVFMKLKKYQGIFRVVGRGKRIKVRMIQDLTKLSATIPKNPWLNPAFEKALTMLPEEYLKALEFQVRRRGLFRG